MYRIVSKDVVRIIQWINYVERPRPANCFENSFPFLRERIVGTYYFKYYRSAVILILGRSREVFIVF